MVSKRHSKTNKNGEHTLKIVSINIGKLFSLLLTSSVALCEKLCEKKFRFTIIKLLHEGPITVM